MSDLIVLMFESLDEAKRARDEFTKMEGEHLVELEDSVIAYKESGHVKLDQTVNLAALGGVSGGFWGLLIGLIFSIPFGGPLIPIFTAVFGAGFGALSGALSDYGVSDEMMTAVAEGFDDGKAALFVLSRKTTTDKVVEHLQGFDAIVLRTSLSKEFDSKLRQVVEKAHATGGEDGSADA